MDFGLYRARGEFSELRLQRRTVWHHRTVPEDRSIEVDVDAICDGKDVFVAGVMEHIEEAGIHSGDSACVMPPYKITLYHYNEFYPSMQNASNYYLTMDNGLRFKIWEGFVSGVQVTTRYNSRPAPGTGDTDNLYLFTLGYSFDTTKKR